MKNASASAASIGNDRRLRQMLSGLENWRGKDRRSDALAILCARGVGYAWFDLERSVAAALLGRTTAKARSSLRRYLHRTLEWITRPCFELEWRSFQIASEALGLAANGKRETTRRFLGSQPGHRLLSIFKKFPVLAELWSLSINQWRQFVTEILDHAAADDRALSRAFFDGRAPGRINDLELGLSDRHHGGRSVTLVEFQNGRVIYKPRSGATESAWSSLLQWMNGHGFRPGFRTFRILGRKNYCWMEAIEAKSCQNAAEASRFYKRLGGLIAAAYLLRVVDCHRENLIAAGENPVLIDIDALWHVSPVTKTQGSIDLLYRTGFFPNADPRSLQSRSSVLGKTSTGAHLARVGGRITSPVEHTAEIVDGFRSGWRCLVGTATRRAAFHRRVSRIRSQKRRWIYLATEKYAAILRASLQPSALTSAAARLDVLTTFRRHDSVDGTVAAAEIEALAQLDIPYFLRRTDEAMPAAQPWALPEVTQAIERTLAQSYRR